MHSILVGKRLIAFDLDGTLIDSVPDLAAAVQRALNELELSMPSEDDVRDWVGNGARQLMARALEWAREAPVSDAQLEAGYEAFMRHYGESPSALTQLYPDVATTLEALHEEGVELALITNKPERFIVPILAHFDLLRLFATYLGGDSLAEKKPSTMPLLHVARQAGIALEECVMIGDSRHDIAAGKAAGFATVAVSYGYNHGDPIAASHPDLIVDSLAALI